MQYDAQPVKVPDPPFSGPCEICGHQEGVLTYRNGRVHDYHCRACTRRTAIYSAAFDHLEFLIREAVRAWLPHWQDLPGVIDLDEHLLQIGVKLHEERKAGIWPWEGVQPSRLAA